MTLYMFDYMERFQDLTRRANCAIALVGINECIYEIDRLMPHLTDVDMVVSIRCLTIYLYVSIYIYIYIYIY